MTTTSEPKTIVSIARGDDQLTTGRHCIGHRLRGVIWQGARVLLKVNQVGGLSPENGSTVHPGLIGLVVEMCREAGAGEVGIAEDAGRFNDTLAVFERLGTTAVARRTGARLIDLRREPHVLRPVPGGGQIASEIEFAQPLLEWDVVIGVTKLKTHHQTGITGALKNFFGAIPDDYKRRFHRLDMDKAIVDINSIRHADFTIVDGFPAMEGVGPHQGTPVPMNLAICGADPVAVDAVCQAVMGFGPNFGRHVRIAAQQDLGVNDLARIDIQGTSIAEVRRPFKTALDQMKERIRGYVEVIDHTDCSGCACAVATTFMLLLGRQGKSLEEFQGLKVYLGKVDAPPAGERALLVGNCVRGPEGYQRWLRAEGGPPSISAIMEAISSPDVELTSFGPEVE